MEPDLVEKAEQVLVRCGRGQPLRQHVLEPREGVAC